MLSVLLDQLNPLITVKKFDDNVSCGIWKYEGEKERRRKRDERRPKEKKEQITKLSN